MSPLPRMNPPKRLLVGGAAALGAGLIAIGPLSALAQDDDEGDGDGWVESVLDDLVDDGTITQAQADAVAGALQDARPEVGPGFGPWGRGRGFGVGMAVLDDAADAIGIEEDDLLDALRDGQTIAEVAEAEGVDPQAVIDALVAAARERADEAVADERIDPEEADERLADLTERITEFVNEGLPAGPFHEVPHRDGGWFKDRWDRLPGDDGDSTDESPSDDDDSTPDSTTPDTTSPDTTSPGGS